MGEDNQLGYSMEHKLNHNDISSRHFPNKSNSHENIVCPFCGYASYSKQRCYEVIGYPDWWDFTKKPRKNQTKVVTTTEDEHSSNASANVAQSGMSDKSTLNNTWIIDTGASDHMINDPSLLTIVKPSSQAMFGSQIDSHGKGKWLLSFVWKQMEMGWNGTQFPSIGKIAGKLLPPPTRRKSFPAQIPSK